MRQRGAGKVLARVGVDGSYGFWEALNYLFSHPSLLLKKLALNLSDFPWLFAGAFNYFFVLFLIVGLVAKRRAGFHLPGEMLLALPCIVYIAGHHLFYLKIRYLLPVVPFCLFWVAQGFVVTEGSVGRLLQRHFPRLHPATRARFALVGLVCISAAVTLPKTLRPQRLEKLPRKEIGLKIAALSDKRPIVLTTRDERSRVAFYANALKTYRLPKKIGTCETLVRYVKKKRIDFIVTDREDHDKPGGHVVALLTKEPPRPEFELVFAYPSNSEEVEPRYAVFRLRD